MDLVEGQRLEIRHDPDNEYDANACAVHSDLGMIGHLPAELAARLVAGGDGPWLGRVEQVLRGETWGVRVEVRGPVAEIQASTDSPSSEDTPAQPAPSGDGPSPADLEAALEADMAAYRADPTSAPVDEVDDVAVGDLDRTGGGVAVLTQRVHARSGRCLGTFVRRDDTRVVVRTAAGAEVAYPAAVVRVDGD